MTTTERSGLDESTQFREDLGNFTDDENSLKDSEALPSDFPIRHLLLDGVEFDKSEYVGMGAFGSVHRAVYGGVACALKQQGFGGRIVGKSCKSLICMYTIQDFQHECLLHSKLHHPNIVKMYGVCYHSDRPSQPIKVMELVEGGTLSTLMSTHHAIPMYVKLSLLQDVSRGLQYLYTHKPPIIHCHINPEVIMLTTTLTAKIGSFTFAQEVVPKVDKVSDSKSNKQAPVFLHQSGNLSFSFDVYLFGGVVCRVVTQVRCGNLHQYTTDADTGKLLVVRDFTHLQQYLDHLSPGPLKQLVMQCLDIDSVDQPSISHVCERIDAILKGELKYCVP